MMWELLNALFTRIPDMEEIATELCEHYHVELTEDGGALWVNGVILATIIMMEEEAPPDLLVSIFSFFEDIVKKDTETKYFFMWTTMYYYCEQKDITDRAVKMMGPETKKLYDEYLVIYKSSKLLQLSQLYSDEEIEAMEQA